MPEEKKRGLIIVYTGSGKGKTTGAMGMALRAVGHKMKVLMVQFIKGSWHCGELNAAKSLYPYFEILPFGKGFVQHEEKGPSSKDIELANATWKFCKEKIFSNTFDMIILDEINYAMGHNLLSAEEVLETLQAKPDRLHIVFTGRNAHPKVLEIADLVTEMKEIKHPYKYGIRAQKGIEF